jgi:ATP-dependent Clp protease adaptor protein ClpS
MSAIHRAIEQVVNWFRPVRIEAILQGSGHAAAGQFTPDGPQFGVEIFNDDKTPMEFVVNVLHDNLGLSYDSAVAVMLHIHNRGSVLLPIEDQSHAERVASAIAAKARDSGHPLVCRAASAQQTVAGDRPNNTSD